MTRFRTDQRYRPIKTPRVAIVAALLTSSPWRCGSHNPRPPLPHCWSETPAGTISPITTCLNGTKTLPGTDVGTIGSGYRRLTVRTRSVTCCRL